MESKITNSTYQETLREYINIGTGYVQFGSITHSVTTKGVSPTFDYVISVNTL